MHNNNSSYYFSMTDNPSGVTTSWCQKVGLRDSNARSLFTSYSQDQYPYIIWPLLEVDFS